MKSTNEGRRNKQSLLDNRISNVVQQRSVAYNDEDGRPEVDLVAKFEHRWKSAADDDQSSDRLQESLTAEANDLPIPKVIPIYRRGRRCDDGDVFSVVSDSTLPNCAMSRNVIDVRINSESPGIVTMNYQKKNIKNQKMQELNKAAVEYAIAAGYDPNLAIPSKISKSKKNVQEFPSDSICDNKHNNFRNDQGEGSVATKCPRLPPKRPLSAYNLFFHLERHRILDSQSMGVDDTSQVSYTVQDLVQFTRKQVKDNEDVNGTDISADTKPKRKHRKTHGKIGFTELARTVASRWRALSEQKKNMFHGYFQTEMNRYKKTYSAWKKTIVNKAEFSSESRTDDMDAFKESLEDLDDQRLLQLAGISSIDSFLRTQGGKNSISASTGISPDIGNYTPYPLLNNTASILNQPASLINTEVLESISYINDLELRKLQLQREIEMYKAQIRTRRMIPFQSTYSRDIDSQLPARRYPNNGRHARMSTSLLNHPMRPKQIGNAFVALDETEAANHTCAPPYNITELLKRNRDNNSSEYYSELDSATPLPLSNYRLPNVPSNDRMPQSATGDYSGMATNLNSSVASEGFFRQSDYTHLMDTAKARLSSLNYRHQNSRELSKFDSTIDETFWDSSPQRNGLTNNINDSNTMSSNGMDAVALADHTFEFATSTLRSPACSDAYDSNLGLYEADDTERLLPNDDVDDRIIEGNISHPTQLSIDNTTNGTSTNTRGNSSSNSTSRWQRLLLAQQQQKVAIEQQQQKIAFQQEHMARMMRLIREANTDTNTNNTNDYLLDDTHEDDEDYANDYSKM